MGMMEDEPAEVALGRVPPVAVHLQASLTALHLESPAAIQPSKGLALFTSTGTLQSLFLQVLLTNCEYLHRACADFKCNFQT